jgi:hypothetical protein
MTGCAGGEPWGNDEDSEVRATCIMSAGERWVKGDVRRRAWEAGGAGANGGRGSVEWASECWGQERCGGYRTCAGEGAGGGEAMLVTS